MKVIELMMAGLPGEVVYFIVNGTAGVQIEHVNGRGERGSSSLSVPW